IRYGERARRSWPGLRRWARARHDGFRCWRPIVERGVRPDGVVVPPPTFDDHSCLLQAVEDLAVEQFVAEPGVEALAEAVLPGAAGRDGGSAGSDCSDPALHRPGDELRAVVGTDVAGYAPENEQVGEHVDHVRRPQPPAAPDRPALP